MLVKMSAVFARWSDGVRYKEYGQIVDGFQATADYQQPAEWRARERELFPLLARKELSASQIGALLHIEPSTIRTYIEQIAEKLGVATTRKAVAAAARERGLLDAP